MAKEEISQNDQVLLLPQCFQPASVIKPIFIELFCVFAKLFSKSYAAEMLYVGNGYSICTREKSSVRGL